MGWVLLKKLYNGNIAETFWSTATDGGFVRNYGYKYDNLNRLKDATYQKSGQLTGMYNENLSYDKNGNIKNLSRNGDRDEQYLPIQIDNLQYGYATNSNKLLNVADNSNNTSGFKDGITTGDDYVYDANGNMTVDKNKNITSIMYNHLNLPTKIIFPTGNIVYFYTASGQKVQKVVTENTTVTTTDYLGGYQYQNTVLQFFSTAEGYVKNTPVSGTNSYSYVFNYTDHLGNTRLSYTKGTTTGSLKILEESNYYPFGLKHTPYNADNFQPGYKYKYNGKELQDELNLNVTAMDFRQYDSSIGRFLGIDLLSELTPSETPNHFGHNNPVFFSDPSGLWSYQAFGNADTSVNMTNDQWLASQRPSDSPVAQMDAMNVKTKNLVSSSPFGSWYRRKTGQSASWDKDNGDFELEEIKFKAYFANYFVPNAYKEKVGGDTKDKIAAGAFATDLKVATIESTKFIKGAELAKGVEKYLFFSKSVGLVGDVAMVGYGANEAYNQYKEEGARAMFLKHRSIYDASVGVGGIYATFALTGPVGWGIGAGVLVYTAITIGWDSTHHANENK